MANAKAGSSNSSKKGRPAISPEARENQMIALAVDLAEYQLRAGTASSQVITHYLKLGTTKYELEKEKLRKENNVLEAKAKSYASSEEIKGLYDNAIKAMRTYGGYGNDEDYDEY